MVTISEIVQTRCTSHFSKKNMTFFVPNNYNQILIKYSIKLVWKICITFYYLFVTMTAFRKMKKGVKSQMYISGQKKYVYI